MTRVLPETTYPQFFYGLMILGLLMIPFCRQSQSALCFLTSLLFIALIGQALAAREHPNPIYQQWSQAICVWVLLALALRPWLKEERVLRLIQILVILAFFGSGVAKLHNEVSWANGYTLRYHLAIRAVHLGLSLKNPLLQNLTLSKFASLFVMVIELSAPLCLLRRRWEMIFLVWALVFHIICYFALDIRWVHYFGWAYFAFPALWWEQRRSQGTQAR